MSYVTTTTDKITLCRDALSWDAFVSNSPQGCIFCTSSFLRALGVDYHAWWMIESNEPYLGALVLTDPLGDPLDAPFSFSLYQGVIFSARHYRIPSHRRIKKGLEAVDLLLRRLEQAYAKISFCLHPLFEDMRSFLWFHYHALEKKGFQVQLNYTGWIVFQGFATFEDYWKTVRPVRRNECHRAQRGQFQVTGDGTLEELEHLHILTFQRQGLRVSSDNVARLNRIALAAQAEGWGELLVGRDQSGKAVSAVLFLYDKNAAYYLVGANDPAFRQSGVSSLVFQEALRRSFARGVERVDVCGMNSPNRGDFKASFNAVPVPYFVATWNSQSNK